MNVRNEPLGKEEKINIDISFLKMPCQCNFQFYFVISIKIVITMNKDEEGGPSTPEHKVVRERLDSQGKTISLVVFFSEDYLKLGSTFQRIIKTMMKYSSRQ